MRDATAEHPAFTLATTVGAIVAADFRTAQVFERHGIDFCCGGQATLADASRERGLDPGVLQRELAEVERTPVAAGHDYSAWTLSRLAEHIVATHHAYLNENTDQIAAYARKIAEVHGARHPEVIKIAAIFADAAADLVDHLREEEEVLFPAVKRIEGARAAGREVAASDRQLITAALETLERDHQKIGDAVHEIRRLADGYATPEDVCNTFVVTYRKLQEFEEDLHKHVHLENNLLFPRAARL